MNAEIVSIGTELLLGEIVDTNSTYIARTLRDIGVNVYYMHTVGDNEQRITGILKQGLSRSDLIITTGGLGPTVDDVTRQAVAAATNRSLEFHQDLLDQIAERFRNFGATMTENNRQQAYLPQGAIKIENPVGTAPCFIVEGEDGIIISLPGVPREMKYLLSQNVIPYLQTKTDGPKVIKALVLKTAGIGESHLDEKIADLMTLTNPTVGLAAHTGQTDIRITACAESANEADQMIAEMETTIRQRVGEYIYGIGDYPLENAVIALLQKLGGKLAIIEAGTDNSLRHRLENSQRGKEILDIAQGYSSIEMLRTALNGAQLETGLNDLTELAAKQILRESKAIIAIGIATYSDGTAIAVATSQKTRKRSYGYGGEESQASHWAGTWGLSMAWRLLQEEG